MAVIRQLYDDGYGGTRYGYFETDGVTERWLYDEGDNTVSPFDWRNTTVYLPTGSNTNVGTNGTDGGDLTLLARLLETSLVKDKSGNLAVKAGKKVDFDQILLRANQLVGLGSTIWDVIKPERIATRKNGNIPNNNTDRTGTDDGSGEIPLNNDLATKKSSGSNQNVGGAKSNTGTDFLQLLKDNWLIVGALLILFFYPDKKEVAQPQQPVIIR
jgi:hypothetical protein